MCLQFGFVIFWQKDFGAKTAHKMLVKLTPGDKHSSLLRTFVNYGRKKFYEIVTLRSTRLRKIRPSFRNSAAENF
jgi:hypothetical protein